MSGSGWVCRLWPVSCHRRKANVHFNVFLTVEPVVIMHWKASFTFQAVLQWFEFGRLTPKRCLQFDYTAFGFNCQLRSCHILVGFLLISPVKPTITSKTKKGTWAFYLSKGWGRLRCLFYYAKKKMIWWISCSDSSNRAQEKNPASVIARVQQVVLFNIRSCAHYENISWHGKYAVALLRERIFIDKTKKYPPHGKWMTVVKIKRYSIRFIDSLPLMDTWWEKIRFISRRFRVRSECT